MSEKSKFEQYCDERGIDPKIAITLICAIIFFFVTLIALAVFLATKKKKKSSSQTQEDLNQTRDATEIENSAKNLLNSGYYFDRTSFIPIIPESKEQEKQPQQIIDKTTEINESIEKLIKESSQKQQDSFDEKTKSLLDEIDKLKSTIADLQNSNKPNDEKFNELSDNIMSNTKKILNEAMEKMPKEQQQSQNNELLETINSRLNGLEQSINDIQNKQNLSAAPKSENKPIIPNYMSHENEISIDGKPQNIQTSENKIQIDGQEQKKQSKLQNNSIHYSNGNNNNNNVLKQNVSQLEIIDKKQQPSGNINVTTNIGGQKQQQSQNTGADKIGADGKGNISNTVYVGGQPFYGTHGFMNCCQPSIQPYHCGCNYFPGHGCHFPGYGCYFPDHGNYRPYSGHGNYRSDSGLYIKSNNFNYIPKKETKEAQTNTDNEQKNNYVSSNNIHLNIKSDGGLSGTNEQEYNAEEKQDKKRNVKVDIINTKQFIDTSQRKNLDISNVDQFTLKHNFFFGREGQQIKYKIDHNLRDTNCYSEKEK